MGDVIESQTSKNIQAAGKLTTTPSPKLRKEKSDPYECPNLSEFSFFPHYCSRHANCLNIGKEYRCCRQFNSKRCVKGVPKPLKEQRHERNLSFFFFSVCYICSVLFSQYIFTLVQWNHVQSSFVFQTVFSHSRSYTAKMSKGTIGRIVLGIENVQHRSRLLAEIMLPCNLLTIILN